MNSKNNSRIGIVGTCCAAVILFAASSAFGAVTNSFFDSGLEGWDHSGDGWVDWSWEGASPSGAGSAVLQQSPTIEGDPVEGESLLSQTFEIDEGSETLTFNIRTPEAGDSETDYLYINLLNTDGDSLFGIENGFFQWSSEEGVFDGSDDVTYVDPPVQASGFVYYDFTVPVSSWVGQSVTLQFKLHHDLLDAETSILVDNVVLNGTSAIPVVPVPGAMGLALAGLMLLGFFKKKLS
jgi:hypothetical protein